MTHSYAVITICRNAAGTIRRAIQSVFSQSLLPERYVFVDGESEDGTPEVIYRTLAALETDGTDCRVLTQTHTPGRAGIPAAWNLGLAEIAEDLVFILNADDWYEPDAARHVIDAFAAEPEVDVVVSPIQYRSKPDAPVQSVQSPRRLGLLPVLMPLPHPGCFVKRSVYSTLGAFDERYIVSADYDFVYRAWRAGMTFRYLSRPLVNMQPGGFARQRLSRARRETREIACRHSGTRVLPWLAFIIRTVLRR